MFSGLLRQNKDAELVIYWGEGHIIRSPGNLRDLYARGLAWLDAYLAVPGAPTADAAARPPDPEPAAASAAPRPLLPPP